MPAMPPMGSYPGLGAPAYGSLPPTNLRPSYMAPTGY